MGQKVHPLAFRLGVPHRSQSSLLFHPDALKTLGISSEGMSSASLRNPTGTSDRRGWDHQVVGATTQEDYAQSSMLAGNREKEIRERREHHQRVLNRWTTRRVRSSSTQQTMRARVEWFPRHGFDLTLEEEQQWALAVTQREAKILSLWGVRLQVESLNLFDLVASSESWGQDRDQRREKAGLAKEDEYLRHLRGRGSSSSKAVKAKADEAPARVTRGALLKVMRRAGVHPVAPGVTRMRVMLLEDQESQRKALSDVRRRRELVATSKHFGLLQRDSFVADEANKDATVAIGGYRGCRRRVKGTLDGSRRTRKEVIQLGTLPLSTMSSPMSYARLPAKTKVGTMGIQVIYHY